MSQPSLNSSHFVIFLPTPSPPPPAAPDSRWSFGPKPSLPSPFDYMHIDYLPLHGTLTGNLNTLRWGSFKPTSPVLHPNPPPGCWCIQETQTQYKDNPDQTEKETGPVTLLGK